MEVGRGLGTRNMEHGRRTMVRATVLKENDVLNICLPSPLSVGHVTARVPRPGPNSATQGVATQEELVGSIKGTGWWVGEESMDLRKPSQKCALS